MNAYEMKRAARIERMRERAERAEKAADSLYSSARSMASVIPFGQPILVGHHSEGRDRKYRARITSKFEKSFETQDKAKYYAQKAEAAENSTAISSDDPEAVVKLREKIAKAEKEQNLMKAANKLLKSKKGPKREELHKLGLTDANIDNLLQPDFCGRIGFPDYAIKNNNANIRRMKERLATLEAKSQDEESETEINGVKIVENVDENRCQVFFDGKPAENVRSYLKSNGFRWSPYNGCWQRQRSNAATYHATKAAEMV